jgi:hypothetical protein
MCANKKIQDISMKAAIGNYQILGLPIVSQRPKAARRSKRGNGSCPSDSSVRWGSLWVAPVRTMLHAVQHIYGLTIWQNLSLSLIYTVQPSTQRKPKGLLVLMMYLDYEMIDIDFEPNGHCPVSGIASSLARIDYVPGSRPDKDCYICHGIRSTF